MQRVAMGTAWKLYFCPHSAPHGTSRLLVPKPSSPQHQSPPESTQKTCGCSARTTCLSSLFWFVNVIIQKHIYHPNLSQMSWCWLRSGLARAGWRGARSLPGSVWRGARGLLCSDAFVSCLLCQHGGFLWGATAPRMLWEDATLKPVRSQRMIMRAFIKVVYQAGTECTGSIG